ncbi:MAG: AmmeMemoRadiSam system protein B [Acidobacteria bacterium]|nr:MAG: AmmeMemoRadiSam system protein B [Acidobacteriota bacterium]
MDPIRRAAVAGSWYPGTPAAIAAEVEGYLAAARPPAVPGRLVGLISPHAGLRYSGPVAAHGYGLLRGRPRLTVVMVGPSHHSAFEGVAVYARGAFETPLGRVPIAEEIAEGLLAAGPALCDDPERHRDEHSLEMQLPFLQHVVPDLRLVPLLMGSQSREEADALAEALAGVLAGRDVLLVASSDLSHYQPAPVANRLDAEVAECVGRFDPEGLMARLERRHDHACGGGPMVAVMKAARSLGADRATVLRYGDSGDVGEGDKSRVVGYLSAALSAPAV